MPESLLHPSGSSGFHDDGDSSNYSFSGELLPSLGVSISRSANLRKFIISPYDPRYRYLNLSHKSSTKELSIKHWWFNEWASALFLFAQGMADVPNPARNLLSVDLPVRTGILKILACETLVAREHFEQLLRHRYRSDLFRCLSRS